MDDKTTYQRNSLRSRSIVRYSNHQRKKRKKHNSGKWAYLNKKAAELRNHPTQAEIIFERKLQELDLKYVFQHPFLYHGIGLIADFYIPKYRMCVEIDGGYHLEENQKHTDKLKDFVYVKMRKEVLRLTNNQAMYLSIEQIDKLMRIK